MGKQKMDFVQITRRDRFSEDEFYPMINSMFERIWENLLPPQLLTQGLSNTIRNNVVTPPDAPIPDCLTCGACCASLLCVGVRPDEPQSADDYWDITAGGEHGGVIVDRYLRRNGETLACSALDGTVGEQVSCRIYEHRPSMCHHFEAGSDRCHAIRRAYGFEPFLTCEEMSDALDKIDARPASEMIQRAQIEELAGTESLKISVVLRDGSVETVHTFDPSCETWRQFEFDGLSLAQARQLIASRTKVEE